MQQFGRDRKDAVASLLSLVQLQPLEIEPGRRLIFTSMPELWSDYVFDKRSRGIDLSRLLGISPSANVTGYALEALVLRAMVSAGWNESVLVQQYRSDLKTSRVSVIDIGVLGPENELVLAIEVKPRDEIAHRGIKELFDSLRSQTSARWLCLTDGDRYFLEDMQTNEQRVYNETPAPQTLGIGEWAISQEPQPELPSDILRPQSVSELRQIVEDFRPESIIIDFSISSNGYLVSEGSEWYGLLPSPIEGRIARILLQDLLLAWVIGFPTIRSISTITASTILTNESSQWLRRTLSDRLPPFAVIELPAGVLPATHLNAAFLILGGSRQRTYFDVLTSVSELTEATSQSWYLSLSAWMKGQKPTTGYTLQMRDATTWAVAANSPEVDETFQRLAKLGELLPLTELCEVIRSTPRVLLSRAISGVATDLQEVHVISAKDIRRGYFDLSNVETLQLPANHSLPTLSNGDVVVPSLLERTFRAFVFESDHRAVPNDSVIVLRPRDERVNGDYLVEFLNSPTVARLVAALVPAMGGGSGGSNAIRRLTKARLSQLRVPIIDATLFEGLSDIHNAERELQAKAQELSVRRQSLFDSPDRSTLAKNVKDLKRRGRLIGESLSKVDQPEFQISNFYPFPIAHGFRLLASKVEPLELYREQLRVAENLLAFLAAISLSLLQEQDRGEGKLDFRRYWGGGISPGHWREITANTTRVLGSYKDHPLAEALVALRITSTKGTFGPAIQRLITAKNDFKHDRGPTIDEDIRNASQEVAVALDTCMQSVSFLTEFPIRQVTKVIPDRRGVKVKLSCLRYTGDHPGLAQEEIDFPRPLHPGDLYIDLGPNGWATLFPFIVARNCPHCKTGEVYFIDKWDSGSGKTSLKSFERGHTEEDGGELSQELAQWPC